MAYKSELAHVSAYTIEKCLKLVGRNFFNEVISTLHLNSNIERKRHFEIITPALLPYNNADKEIISRILGAYKRAKEVQKKCDPVYLPSSLWQNQLDAAYCNLWSPDIKDAVYFLINFGAWPVYTGIENTVLISELSRTRLAKRKLYKMLDTLLSWWVLHEQRGRPLEVLNYPRYGNQYGVNIDGVFVSVGSVFNDVHSYSVASLLSHERAIVAEIGGGYGKFFYFISKKLKNFCYIDFDLPETLCCAAYYLLKSFPDKKFLLFGEEEFSADSINKYDFILLPSFCIEELPSNSVDIFVNQTSLGEMLPLTTKRFIKEIERTTQYFWHMNHEFIRNYFDNGSASLINSEYTLSSNRFNLIARYLDIGHATYQGGFNYNSDIYCYLYKRISKES